MIICNSFHKLGTIRLCLKASLKKCASWGISHLKIFILLFISFFIRNLSYSQEFVFLGSTINKYDSVFIGNVLRITGYSNSKIISESNYLNHNLISESIFNDSGKLVRLTNFTFNGYLIADFDTNGFPKMKASLIDSNFSENFVDSINGIYGITRSNKKKFKSIFNYINIDKQVITEFDLDANSLKSSTYQDNKLYSTTFFSLINDITIDEQPGVLVKNFGGVKKKFICRKSFIYDLNGEAIVSFFNNHKGYAHKEKIYSHKRYLIQITTFKDDRLYKVRYVPNVDRLLITPILFLIKKTGYFSKSNKKIPIKLPYPIIFD